MQFHDAAAWMVWGTWGALVVYLTVAAFGVKRDSETHLGQSFMLLGAMILAFVLPQLPLFAFVNYATTNPVLLVVGLVLDLGGSAFLVWGRQALGRNWSQTVAEKEGHELVTWGPLAIVRNPMYTGGLAAGLGAVIVVGGAWVFMSLLLGVLFVTRVFAEDALLARQFPEAYPVYRARTKALIPFVW